MQVLLVTNDMLLLSTNSHTGLGRVCVGQLTKITKINKLAKINKKKAMLGTAPLCP